MTKEISQRKRKTLWKRLRQEKYSINRNNDKGFMSINKSIDKIRGKKYTALFLSQKI